MKTMFRDRNKEKIDFLKILKALKNSDDLVFDADIDL